MRIVRIGEEELEIPAFRDCEHVHDHTYRIYYEAGCYIEVNRAELLGMLMRMTRADIVLFTEHHGYLEERDGVRSL